MSIEARRGVTTGVSAADRVTTVRAAIDPANGPDDLARPGHIFPLRAATGGVLARRGHTEASVDLAVMAGLGPAAVLCELMNDDGTAEAYAVIARCAEQLFPGESGELFVFKACLDPSSFHPVAGARRPWYVLGRI